jgi:hypothetical protein
MWAKIIDKAQSCRNLLSLKLLWKCFDAAMTNEVEMELLRCLSKWLGFSKLHLTIRAPFPTEHCNQNHQQWFSSLTLVPATSTLCSDDNITLNKLVIINTQEHRITLVDLKF